jgi:hypothetical protein
MFLLRGPISVLNLCRVVSCHVKARRAVHFYFFIFIFISCCVVFKIDKGMTRHSYDTTRIRHVMSTMPCLIVSCQIVSCLYNMTCFNRTKMCLICDKLLKKLDNVRIERTHISTLTNM